MEVFCRRAMTFHNTSAGQVVEVQARTWTVVPEWIKEDSGFKRWKGAITVKETVIAPARRVAENPLKAVTHAPVRGVLSRVCALSGNDLTPALPLNSGAGATWTPARVSFIG